MGDVNLGAIDEHRIEPLMHQPAGQSIAYCREIESVRQVMQRLQEELEEAQRRLGVVLS